VLVSAGGMQEDLSEQVLLQCSGTRTCSGGSSASASDCIRDVGPPLESCFRYTATNGLCSHSCLDWQNAVLVAG
jgi:hypothetical protein